ncbi:MAG TPA: 4Fe-4S dicluster domain-containing protein [Sedimentisphaerales bacterium]|nr:4Fe-4S dicluster domain-containing protein [Sedimentisphaerales bacterium]
MAAKLVIDLAKSNLQAESKVRCSYKHHPENKGIDSLLEMIRFALICRRCEAAPCINACPQGALEKIPSKTHDAGILKRANMLCTGCGTCAIACPFGTIYTDLIPFPSSVCDRSKGRLKPGEKPLCVNTCRDGSIDYREVDLTKEDDLVEVFEDIVVKVSGGQLWEPFLREGEKVKK